MDISELYDFTQPSIDDLELPIEVDELEEEQLRYELAFTWSE